MSPPSSPCDKKRRRSSIGTPARASAGDADAVGGRRRRSLSLLESRDGERRDRPSRARDERTERRADAEADSQRHRSPSEAKPEAAKDAKAETKAEAEAEAEAKDGRSRTRSDRPHTERAERADRTGKSEFLAPPAGSRPRRARDDGARDHSDRERDRDLDHEPKRNRSHRHHRHEHREDRNRDERGRDDRRDRSDHEYDEYSRSRDASRSRDERSRDASRSRESSSREDRDKHDRHHQPTRAPSEKHDEPGKSTGASDKTLQPDFGLSGRLAAETNMVNGVVLKYSEPAEARRPAGHWRIYVFKDGKDIDMHHVDTASGFLFGRDRKVADIPIDHPSCSSQHAVLQYRQTGANIVKPFLIDLASTNGTFLNGDQIPKRRYVELRSEDVIKFGFSTREYVLLCE
ncbi:hypothetical protein GGI07_004168 [Coemansia sp. Benny D115]|nr:hypothetical protein GGI07_004168 [Coemansia sp. Benny D115]